MKYWKARTKLTYIVFLFIDITLMVILPLIQQFLEHEWFARYQTKGKTWTRLGFSINLLPSCLEAVFSLILVISACQIASWITRSTGKRQNTCLLTWHVINLFLLAAVTTLYAIFYYGADSVEEGSVDWIRYEYLATIAMLAQLNIGLYVDLFLLWLLYRFMKPQNILQDGSTEASALLFAHDGLEAQIHLGQCSEDEDNRQKELPEGKHQGFIAFLIKNLVADIATETSVVLEFMDRSERDSITSSICLYAKAEEISEQMEDAYPTSDNQWFSHLQTSRMSTQGENLLENN